MRCPECKSEMKKTRYDAGFGIVIDSMRCEQCGHNVTNEKDLDLAIKKMKKKMAIKIKVLQVGSGIGIRFPNEIADKLHLKKGQKIEIMPMEDEIVIKKEAKYD